MLAEEDVPPAKQTTDRCRYLLSSSNIWLSSYSCSRELHMHGSVFCCTETLSTRPSIHRRKQVSCGVGPLLHSLFRDSTVWPRRTSLPKSNGNAAAAPKPSSWAGLQLGRTISRRNCSPTLPRYSFVVADAVQGAHQPILPCYNGQLKVWSSVVARPDCMCLPGAKTDGTARRSTPQHNRNSRMHTVPLVLLVRARTWAQPGTALPLLP